MPIDYSTPGVITALTPDQRQLAAELPADPVAICRAVAGLIVHPAQTGSLGLPEPRMGAQAIRPVTRILDELLAIDPAPLTKVREPRQRVVGTCRHFATVSVALLQAHGIPARARCGFASYFRPDRHVDHWVVEHWVTGRADTRESSDGESSAGRWVRIDPEILDGTNVPHPDDLAPGEFLTGGEAWQLVRSGDADPATFGVNGTDHAWGPAEIRGNAIRDLAALVQVETLPWDEWGRMEASYRGETGPDYDHLVDLVAQVCAEDDAERVRVLYNSEDLAVPAELRN
ncbi:hypothetical protein HDA40_000012 [Hamadaea flava]|uniref:Transglutaminase-like domain-containing protein n=1 Tax=Hamadaea flava TaxID=1742688 RepID=A0ABV8LNT4_9ACTN|nr:transglutaminase-like domain-containing protein [Hamadaea flava]MCP2321505.1 hypothetical protein [Hamadaea flava]